jgi:hypothetical protein
MSLADVHRASDEPSFQNGTIARKLTYCLALDILGSF